ncbi:MAG: hypothetical protein DHS20C15_00790 [Planctomycetota bacterium]|nr:MAG: hypothetical protein DHS20C15_00790 [Planctomycetota bacterium]
MTRARALTALILLVALALRLWGLGRWSFDGDELYSWFSVQRLLTGDEWRSGTQSFPLGYLLMAGSAWLLGASEWSLRLLPALFSWGSVAALLLMRRDVGCRGDRWLAAGVAALSPWMLFHAQSARFYGLLVGLVTVALLWSLPGSGRRPRRAWGALLLATLCHPSAALLVPALALGNAGRPALLRRVGLLALATLGLAAALVFSEGSSPHQVLDRLMSGADPGRYDLAHFLLGLAYNFGPLLGLLALAGSWGLLRSSLPERRVLLLAGLVPPAVLLLASLAGLSVHQRYALVAVPGLLLLATHGFRGLPSRALRGVVLAGLVLIPAPRLLAHLNDGSRHDTRAVAQFLAQNADPDDALVLEQHAMIELYLHEMPRFADSFTSEAPVAPRRQHDLARQLRESWLALKASHRQRPEEEAWHAWVDQVYTEVARVGRPPWPLVRHDNQYVIYRRTRRLPPSKFRTPTSGLQQGTTPDPMSER